MKTVTAMPAPAPLTIAGNTKTPPSEPALRMTAPGKKAAAKKPAAAKSRAPRKSATKPVVKAGFTHEDVALRAYFVAEKRVATGAPGDEHSDWVEAERQLRAERGPAA